MRKLSDRVRSPKSGRRPFANHIREDSYSGHALKPADVDRVHARISSNQMLNLLPMACRVHRAFEALPVMPKVIMCWQQLIRGVEAEGWFWGSAAKLWERFGEQAVKGANYAGIELLNRHPFASSLTLMKNIKERDTETLRTSVFSFRLHLPRIFDDIA